MILTLKAIRSIWPSLSSPLPISFRIPRGPLTYSRRCAVTSQLSHELFQSWMSIRACSNHYDNSSNPLTLWIDYLALLFEKCQMFINIVEKLMLFRAFCLWCAEVHCFCAQPSLINPIISPFAFYTKLASLNMWAMRSPFPLRVLSQLRVLWTWLQNRCSLLSKPSFPFPPSPSFR